MGLDDRAHSLTEGSTLSTHSGLTAQQKYTIYTHACQGKNVCGREGEKRMINVAGYILFISFLFWVLEIIKSHLSSIDTKLNYLSSLENPPLHNPYEADLFNIKSSLDSLESDVSSIKEELESSLGESIKDKLDEIIVKLEELIEKR